MPPLNFTFPGPPSRKSLNSHGHKFHILRRTHTYATVLAASGDTDVSVVPLYFISVRATPTGSWIFWAVYRVPIDLWYVIPFEVVAGGGGAPPPRAFGKPWDFPLTSENRRCRAPSPALATTSGPSSIARTSASSPYIQRRIL